MPAFDEEYDIREGEPASYAPGTYSVPDPHDSAMPMELPRQRSGCDCDRFYAGLCQ